MASVSVHFVPSCHNTPPPTTTVPQVVNARNILLLYGGYIDDHR